MTKPVDITPLGGVGEFGMNCMMYDCGDQRVLVDCGSMFPGEEHYGVDLIVPDFETIEKKPIDALVLTHGHEDHIGSVPWLVKERIEKNHGKLPIFGTKFTMALIHRKLDEQGLLDAVELRQVDKNSHVELGDFSFEFIHVNHSIPDAMSVVIHTPAGTVLMTGDWRIDPTPVGEDVIDFQRFAELGEQGVRLMMGDSTNVETVGSSVSESEVAREIEDVLEIAAGRVLFTMFSSNIWRVQSILDAAYRVGRRVATLGRSVQQNIAAARETGFLTLPSDHTLIDITEVDQYADHELVIIAAGSQGEPRSNLTRIAFGGHNLFSVKEGDWLVYSARMIPGNQKAIGKVVDALHTRGVEVIIPKKQALHTSGHAYREEIKTLMNIVKPEVLMPVHGNMRQLSKHVDLGREMGVDTVLVTNGTTLRLEEQSHRIVGELQLEPTYVVGNDTHWVNGETLRQRRQIGFTGVLIVQAIVSRDGKILKVPQVVQHGVVKDESLIREAEAAAEEVLNLIVANNVNAEEIAEEIRLAVRRYFKDKIGRKPLVLPMVDVINPD